ncbi:MAG: TolC family protein, partial [Thermoanaerobaculia bacterium]
VALANNPATRASWMTAKAAASHEASARADYFPEIDLGAQVIRQKSGSGGGRSAYQQTVWGPTAAVNFLLLDFGGRGSRVQQARDALIAADFAHNATIQNVVLRVAQAYYGYLNAKTLLSAQESTVREMQANYDAAEARHRAGVATIADVLQAKTSLSQAQLVLESIHGTVQTVQGSLAVAAGLPATTTFEVGLLPPSVPATQVGESIDSLIDRAVRARPDLLQMRALAERAHARIREVRSQGLPTLSLSSSGSRNDYTGDLQPSTNYSFGLQLRLPVYTGMKNAFDVREARALAEAADAQALSFQQQVELEVWSSYFDLKTAQRRVAVAHDLLASAEESEKVAAGRYKEGVGSILDLLTAQAALENARAEEITARSDWFLSLAQLAHDIGSIDLGEATGAQSTEIQ